MQLCNPSFSNPVVTGGVTQKKYQFNIAFPYVSDYKVLKCYNKSIQHMIPYGGYERQKFENTNGQYHC